MCTWRTLVYGSGNTEKCVSMVFYVCLALLDPSFGAGPQLVPDRAEQDIFQGGRVGTFGGGERLETHRYNHTLPGLRQGHTS